MFKTLKSDFQNIFDKDPAARNFFEVLFLYPGLQAVISHRFAHFLYQKSFNTATVSKSLGSRSGFHWVLAIALQTSLRVEEIDSLKRSNSWELYAIQLN